jgi:hypothetical protein
MAKLESLPVEIFYKICSDLPGISKAALCRTNKQLHNLTESLLYESIQINGFPWDPDHRNSATIFVPSKAREFLITLLKRPDLAASVKHLSVTYRHRWYPKLAETQMTAFVLGNLRRFYYDYMRDQPSESPGPGGLALAVVVLLSQLHNLRSLKLHNFNALGNSFILRTLHKFPEESETSDISRLQRLTHLRIHCSNSPVWSYIRKPHGHLETSLLNLYKFCDFVGDYNKPNGGKISGKHRFFEPSNLTALTLESQIIQPTELGAILAETRLESLTYKFAQVDNGSYGDNVLLSLSYALSAVADTLRYLQISTTRGGNLDDLEPCRQHIPELGHPPLRRLGSLKELRSLECLDLDTSLLLSREPQTLTRGILGDLIPDNLHQLSLSIDLERPNAKPPAALSRLNHIPKKRLGITTVVMQLVQYLALEDPASRTWTLPEKLTITPPRYARGDLLQQTEPLFEILTSQLMSAQLPCDLYVRQLSGESLTTFLAPRGIPIHRPYLTSGGTGDQWKNDLLCFLWQRQATFDGCSDDDDAASLLQLPVMSLSYDSDHELYMVSHKDYERTTRALNSA